MNQGYQIILSKKRNTTPHYGYTVKNISYVSRNWNMPHITWLLKMSICRLFWRGWPTVMWMAHFCILHLQTVLTHKGIHWLMSYICGRLASMHNVSVCAETHFFVPHRDLQYIICPHFSCRGLSEFTGCLEIWCYISVLLTCFYGNLIHNQTMA